MSFKKIVNASFDDIMDLNLLSVGRLVPEALCCMLYATRHHVYIMFDADDMVFVVTDLLSHTHSQRNTHSSHMEP